jgi:hypothetical protein
LLAPSPDPAFGFRLNPRHSILRDDEHKLAITPTGLLTSVDVVATDRTAEALVELATFAGAISNPIPRRTEGERKPCPQVIPEEVTAVVDFADQNSVDELNSSVACMGARLTTKPHRRLFTQSQHPGPGAKYDGIVYRSPNEVLVQIEKCQNSDGACIGDTGWFPTQVLALMLPQAGPISHVPQNAGFFTRTKYALTLKDGVLTSYDASRPSEVAHAAALPMRIFQGFADGVSKVISIRTGRNTAEAAYFNSELAATQARTGGVSGSMSAQEQLAAGRTDLLEALLRDQARREAIRKCSDLLAQGRPLSACDLDP